MENEKISDVSNLCRFCLQHMDNPKNIHELTIANSNEIRMVDFIGKLCTLKFSSDDGLPQGMCDPCVDSFNRVYNLIELCLSSDEKLRAFKEAQSAEAAAVENDVEITELECSGELNDEKGLASDADLRCDEKTVKKEYECEICGKKFLYEYLLKQHSYKHTDKKPFPCSKCDKGCITKESLRRHMVVHNENYTKRKHRCEVCDKEFPYPSFLAEHMKNHTGERPFLCSVCGKGFRQSGALAYHLRSHSGARPYKCDLCDGYFVSRSTLRVHMRRHTNERPYVCDICGMAFRQSTDMKSHRRIHMGERRVLCFICGKRMATTGQLTVHMRSHTGEKPFKCTTCGKGFATRTMLVKHDRIHTGERPYTCDVCNKSFNQRSTLKTHLNTHKEAETEQIVIEEYIVDQEMGTQYSIETVQNDLDLSRTEVNVVVLPAPVPLLLNL